MTKKDKHNQESENLVDEGTSLSNVQEELLSDESLFIDDTRRHWAPNEKRDKDNLILKQHLLIFHIAIKSSWFPDDLYPTLWDKCVHYHQERDLKSIDVTVESFYKSYSSIEYSDLKVPKRERNRPKKISKYSVEIERPKYRIIKKKYISLELIDSVIPFILKWYPTAVFFIQTLNNDTYQLNEEHFYFIYRRVKSVSTEKVTMKGFFDSNCPHLNFNSFTSKVNRNRDQKIPSDINRYINPYMRMYYPDVLKEEKRISIEKQVSYKRKVTQIYSRLSKLYLQKFKRIFSKQWTASHMQNDGVSHLLK